MKIAIPVMDDQTDEVCIVFGRAPQFAVLDTATDVLTYIKNPAADVQGGAGLQAAQAIVDHGIDVLLTARLGENSAEIFREVGIQIYKINGESAKENLNAYREGKLSELTHFHAGYQGNRP